MLANQLAQKQRRQPPTINITKVTQGQSQGRANIYVIQAEVDAHDGKGFIAMTAEVVRVPPFDAQGNWSMTAYQAFANILLDQTVVRDADNHVRGTISNDYAVALVKANSNRFQYVPTQHYLKGIDY